MPLQPCDTETDRKLSVLQHKTFLSFTVVEATAGTTIYTFNAVGLVFLFQSDTFYPKISFVNFNLVSYCRSVCLHIPQKILHTI